MSEEKSAPFYTIVDADDAAKTLRPDWRRPEEVERERPETVSASFRDAPEIFIGALKNNSQ